MTTLFQIAVGHDDKTGQYSVLAQCLADGQIARNDGPDLRKVMANVSKSLRAKARQLKNFPAQEPSRIIQINGGANGNGAQKLIVPATN